MATLKEEYQKRKILEEKKQLAELYQSLKENFVILEAIDRQELLRMAQAMEKLESVFKSLPDKQKKIPLLSSIIDTALADAEKFVSDVIEGKLNPASLMSLFVKNKFDNPLMKIMGLFTTLTNFLKFDVDPVLKVYRADKNPTVPLYTLQNANEISNAFAKAMMPKGFFASLGIKQIPYIGASLKNVATEFANLTPQELAQLKNSLQQIQIPISGQDLKTVVAGKNPIETAPTNAEPPTNNPSKEPSTLKPISIDMIKSIGITNEKQAQYLMTVLKMLNIPTSQ